MKATNGQQSRQPEYTDSRQVQCQNKGMFRHGTRRLSNQKDRMMQSLQSAPLPRPQHTHTDTRLPTNRRAQRQVQHTDAHTLRYGQNRGPKGKTSHSRTGALEYRGCRQQLLDTNSPHTHTHADDAKRPKPHTHTHTHTHTHDLQTNRRAAQRWVQRSNSSSVGQSNKPEHVQRQ